VIGQAVFTIYVIVLFGVIAPTGWQLGLVRLEDVALGAATSIVVALPASAGRSNASALLHLPVIDRPAVRAHMARVIHHSLLGEVTAMQKNLDRLVHQSLASTEQGRPGAIRPNTVANRLSEYRAMRAKIELYGEILGERQHQALKALGELQMAARSLLDNAAGALADGESNKQGAAESQAGWAPDSTADRRPYARRHQAA
jgi:CTP:molybdopterin cytidylyltransferase MocA